MEILNSKQGLKNGRDCMPVRFRGKMATRFCVFPKVKSAEKTPGRFPVYLNVYDLTHYNGYVYWAGIGIFHTGIEVHGVEYAFGAHDFPTSGVFEVEPRQCPGFRFRRSILMGTTSLDPDEAREFMEKQSTFYHGDSYHLIVKNCNHFCDDICRKLTGRRIPRWVNRLANIGSVCNCILPESLKVTKVPNNPDVQKYSEKKKLRNNLSCLSSVSETQDEVSISSVSLNSHYRGYLLTWEPSSKQHELSDVSEETRTQPELED